MAFAREHIKPVVKMGLIGEKLYTKEEILHLATLPPLDEMLAQVVGTLTAPMTSFLGAVNALLGAPAQLTDALGNKQQG